MDSTAQGLGGIAQMLTMSTLTTLFFKQELHDLDDLEDAVADRLLHGDATGDVDDDEEDEVFHAIPVRSTGAARSDGTDA